MQTITTGTNVPTTKKNGTDNKPVIKAAGTNVPIIELPAEYRLIKRLVDAGGSQRAIARMIGVSHTTIQRHLKDIDLIIKHNEIVQEYENEIVSYT